MRWIVQAVRRRIGRRSALALAVAVVGAAATIPASAMAAGPVILAGIDAEDGGPGGHGPIANYVKVVNQLLANVHTPTSGILVVGAGKGPTDDPTTFWDAIDAAIPSESVTYVNGESAIASVDFSSYRLIAIVSDEHNTGSGLTAAEDAALDARQADLASFINGGGGLLGFTSDGANPYGYLSGLGLFAANVEQSYDDIEPVGDGAAIGLDNDLDICCWHDTFTAYPAFLQVLAKNTLTGEAAAIGGLDIVVSDKDQPAAISLSPDEGGAATSTRACFTATIRDSENDLLEGKPSIFSVSGANNVAGSATTDAAGRSVFCYVGTFPGSDTINVFADTNGNGFRDGNEPADRGGWTWRATPSRPKPADRDNDTIVDSRDNCEDRANTDQKDVDADGIGDVCDASNGALPPVLEKTVSARVVSGTVLIKKGSRYVPLVGAETIPVGSTLDATKGSVRIVAASDTKKATQTGTFSSAIFAIKQKRVKGAKTTPTDIVLNGGAFASSCKTTKKKGKKVASKGVIRTLNAVTLKGVWRTKGRASVTTVSAGATLLTQDRCDGTLTTVKAGKASVRDIKRQRTVRLRAGRSYLAAQVFAAKTRRHI
jgi:hypothetical protein